MSEHGGDIVKGSVMIANASGVAELTSLARAAEQAGFSRVWLAENNGLEAASAAAAVACTTGLEVGTAIVPVFTRSPALLTMMASTLSDLSRRPVHLGIGAGGQVLVRDWHGQNFDTPLTAVREAIDIIEQALTGERTSYAGKVHRCDGFRLSTPPAAPVHVYVGGMGPKMTELAGQRADGLILTWIPASDVPSYRKRLDESAAGRPQRPRLVTRIYVAVVDDLPAVREGVRHEMVEYLLSPPYGRYFTSIGHGADVDGVRAAFAAGDRTASAAAVSDELLDKVLIAGTSTDDLVDAIASYLHAGADECLFQPVPIARSGDPVRTIHAAAEALRRADSTPTLASATRA